MQVNGNLQSLQKLHFSACGACFKSPRQSLGNITSLNFAFSLSVFLKSFPSGYSDYTALIHKCHLALNLAPSIPVIKKNVTILSFLGLSARKMRVLTISYNYLLNKKDFNYLNKSHILRRLIYFLNLGGEETILGKYISTIIKNFFY